MILSFYRQRLGMSLRTFQGLTGGGGGLSIWRLLSIQKNAPLHQIMQSRKKKKIDFLFFLISEGSSEGEHRPEKGAWLCGSKFIPFHLLISEIPFELDIQLSYSAPPQKDREASETPPTPRSAEGREAVFSGCLWGVSVASYKFILEGRMSLPTFGKQCICG